MEALVENIQRADLNAVEEAQAYHQLKQLHGLTVEQIARAAGVSIGTVYNRLEILNLDEPIQQLIAVRALPADRYVVQGFQRIGDAGTRVRLARKLAQQKAPARVIIAQCNRIAGAQSDETPEPFAKTEKAPALALSERQQPVEKTRWNALAQAGQLPKWAAVKAAAAATCDYCPLSDDASVSVCRECALPHFLIQLLKEAK